MYIYICTVYIYTYTYDNQSATCPPKELTLFPEELKVFKAAPERCPPAGCADVFMGSSHGCQVLGNEEKLVEYNSHASRCHDIGWKG